MNLLEVRGHRKRTLVNLDTLTRLDLLEDGRIELSLIGGYFDVLSEGGEGYLELRKLFDRDIEG